MTPDPGVALELGVLYVIQTLGHSIFDKFEVETEAWRKIVKWVVVAAVTIGLYFFVGHWALTFTVGAGILGCTFHFVWCRKNGIHPLRATPRAKYYELRGWDLPE
ncbi:MAG: hypothetical protein ACE5GX_09400 [Thermoanaerobaculia bacterium]